MTEQTPLTDKALTRLLALASGNGMGDDPIELLQTQEQTVTLTAAMTLRAGMAASFEHFPGVTKTKGSEVFGSINEMHQAASTKKTAFESGLDWIPETLAELQKAPGYGWGLDGAEIVLPTHQIVLCASENCPTCHGNGGLRCTECQGQQLVLCTLCQGRGKELCIYCNNTGRDPHNPARECTYCQGTNWMLCRQCQGRMSIPCPTCQGRGHLVCGDCKGAGRITEQVKLKGMVQTSFRLERTTDLPSGFLRAMDRLGIANLAKGHATITMTPPKDDPEVKDSKKTLRYKAEVPFAEMRMRFGASGATLVSCFGLKAALLEVPAFLDEALIPARKALHQATKDGNILSKARHARAVEIALSLEAAGQGGTGSKGLQAIRRHFPLGLSAPVMTELMRHARKALIVQTRNTRTMAALTLFTMGALIIAGIHFSSFPLWLNLRFAPVTATLLYLAPLVLLLGVAWFGLASASAFALKRLFPKVPVTRAPKIGKTGYSLMAGLTLVYFLCLLIGGVKPGLFSLWLG